MPRHSPDPSAVQSALYFAVEEAEDLSDLLAAASQVFDYACQALRGAEDRAGPLRGNFVMAAVVADDGSKAIAAHRLESMSGPALRADTPRQAADTAPPAEADVAGQVARLCLALYTRLREAAAAAGEPLCAAAAARAAQIYNMLTPG